MDAQGIRRPRAFLFSLLPLAVLLLVTELVLRFGPFDFTVEALRVEYAADPSARMFQGHLTSEHFEADPVTFWTPRPGVPPFNAEGYRGPVVPEEKSAGTLRVLAVGDSNTLGHAASWVDEIGRHLRGGDVEVLNAGVYGYTTYQGKIRLERFLRYQPDVVLISFGGNDPVLNVVADKDYVPYRPHPFFAFFHHRLATVDLLEYLSVRGALRRAEDTERPAVPRVAPDDYAANLEAMVELARAAGARPVLLTRPMASDFRREEGSPLKVYDELTRKVAEREAVPWIDVHAMANHSWVLFADHAHFNEKGHRVVGEYVAAELTQLFQEHRLQGDGVDGPPPVFSPRNRDERATHVVGRVVHAWRKLPENVRDLREHPLVEDLIRVYSTEFRTDRGGLRVRVLPHGAEEDSVRVRDGGLCLSPDLESATLVHGDLGLNPEAPHFVWVEGRSHSDLSLTMSWRDDASDAFDPKHATAVVHRYVPGDPPIRLFHALPSGTRTVRLDVTVERPVDDVCFKRIYVAEMLVPGRSE